jgi:hypothetical protein
MELSKQSEQVMESIASRTGIAVVVSVIVTVAAVAPQRALSHHSFAMYDRDKTEVVTGKLTRFIPGANHAQLIFEQVDANGETVTGDEGKPMVWGVETGPAGAIARQGVTVESFPIGTVMTVALNPLRNGRPFGVLAGAGIVACGMELPENGCTEETGEVFLASQND